MTMTLAIATSWNVSFPKKNQGRFWRKHFLRNFWPVFMGTCFSAPILLIYRLQDIPGCNINPLHYQITTIYIQYLPSRLFLWLGFHFQNMFSKPIFKQKTEKLKTSEYLRKVLLGFDDVIKKTSSKKLFQKLHIKLISLVMSDKFVIIICHSNNLIYYQFRNKRR